MTVLPGADVALAPVRAALLRAAREQAATTTARARRDAAALLASARRDAAAAVAQGRADGQAEARPLVAAQLSRGRQEPRSQLLRARRDAYDQLRQQVLAGVAALPGEPGYRALLDRLTKAALAAAGPGATASPHPDGGVIATAPGVVVDCSLPTLASQAVEAISAELGSLWGDGPQPPAAAPEGAAPGIQAG